MTATDGKYGVITSEHKQFHDEEPIFILRATDRLAAAAIRAYAILCDVDGCDDEHIEAARRHAERIEQWQRDNRHHVKRPD